MQFVELYLPSLIPLWGIFIGIALVIIGYVDKKSVFTYLGWSALMVVGMVSLYFNLFQIDRNHYPEGSQLRETADLLLTTGYLNVAGTFLALAAMLFFYYRKSRYLLLAVMTILFFSIQFFQFYTLVQKPK